MSFTVGKMLWFLLLFLTIPLLSRKLLGYQVDPQGHCRSLFHCIVVLVWIVMNTSECDYEWDLISDQNPKYDILMFTCSFMIVDYFVATKLAIDMKCHHHRECF